MKSMLLKTMLAASVATALLPVVAMAQGRPNTTAMSCAAARGLVARSGAIVLSTGGPTYDRYVVHRGFCSPDQEARPAWVPAADTPSCPVGNRCVDVIWDRN